MPMGLSFDVMGDTRDAVGECPTWSVAEQALYWVDIEGRTVRRLDWASRAVRSWRVTERIGCIALHSSGGLLAAMESGLFHLVLNESEQASQTLLAPVRFARADMRFNDGRCDHHGCFWVTSMVRDTSLGMAHGNLYRFDGITLEQTPVGGLVTGNGLAFSPAGDWLYLSDSHHSVRKVWRFPVTSTGRLGERSNFGDWSVLSGRPDGAAVDESGGYWSCANDAGKVHRFNPDGQWDLSLELPVSKPSMCAFGGPALRHLFITSIKPATPVSGFDTSLDGALLVCQPGAQGRREPLFGQRTTADQGNL